MDASSHMLGSTHRSILVSTKSSLGTPNIWLCCFLASAIAMLSLPVSNARKTDPYAYACDSKTFGLKDFGDPKAFVESPDSQNRIVLARDGAFAVLRGKERLARVEVRELSCCIEVGWSPDSTQFFLRWSGGGSIGEYYVRVFRIEHREVMELKAPKTAYAEFNKHHSCETRTNNIFMLGWTRDSQKMFLVTEVYPTSDCEHSGLFRGYLMNVQTQLVLKIFGEIETEAIKKSSQTAGVVQIPNETAPEDH